MYIEKAAYAFQLDSTPVACKAFGNGHINNTCYADYVMDALSPGEGMAVRQLQIDYHRELMQDMPVQLYWKEEDGVVLAKGVSGEGECMFSCCLELA